MPNTGVVIALLIAGFVGSETYAQQAPAAVIGDPAVDNDYPATLSILTIPSHGVDLDAFFYLASGPGQHGTVVLLHGLPGYELNEDLAQSIRRAGWNVLLFHYRGTWGVGGAFSLSSAIDDTLEVIHFLRQPSTLTKYRIDPQRLVLIGHSFGGFLAGYASRNDADLWGVAIISATNLGTMAADPKQREARLRRWESQLHPVHGATASDLFREAEGHGRDWDYTFWAEKLCHRSLLLVEAEDQNRGDMQALAASMREKHCTALEQRAVPTDHSFSDHRIALQTIVVEWLNNLRSRPKPDPD